MHYLGFSKYLIIQSKLIIMIYYCSINVVSNKQLLSNYKKKDL